MKIIKPKKIKAGATIGLITPGSAISKEQLDATILKLKELGFNSFYYDSVLSKTGFLAGNDEERVDEIHKMFKNSDIDAIMCVRGGYGCGRILTMLDYSLIRKHAKPFIGYSDVTTLLFAIYKHARLICFHGLMGVSDFNEYSMPILKSLLTGNTTNFVIEHKHEESEKPEDEYYIINHGIAEGILIGGNLCLALTLMGTPYELDFDNKILFFEDIDEPPYSIDRLLTQLYNAGKLQKAAGIIFGICRDCDLDGAKYSVDNSFTLKEVITERLSKLKIPVVYGFSFGHIKNIASLPLGIQVRLNTDLKTITLLESALE